VCSPSEGFLDSVNISDDAVLVRSGSIPRGGGAAVDDPGGPEMVAEVKAKMVQVTPEMRLIQVLDDAAGSPVFLERDGVVFRLSREPEDRAKPASPQAETMPEPTREERLAIVERMIQRRDAFFQGRVLSDDSTDILRREREARSRHVAGL
jgi:hypothetical protein